VARTASARARELIAAAEEARRLVAYEGDSIDPDVLDDGWAFAA